MSKYIRRQQVVEDGSSPLEGVCVDSLMEKLPALVEYLSVQVYEDGERRETSTLTLFWEDGLFKGCLNDRDQLKSCFLSSASLMDLLVRFESGLELDELEWRKKRQGFLKKTGPRS